MSGPLMPSLETICVALFNDMDLHLIFLSDNFNSLMLFTNLHFSTNI